MSKEAEVATVFRYFLIASKDDGSPSILLGEYPDRMTADLEYCRQIKFPKYAGFRITLAYESMTRAPIAEPPKAKRKAVKK
jgi:hypothetical protein